MDFSTLKSQVLAQLDAQNIFTLNKGDITSTAIDELFDQFVGETDSLTIDVDDSPVEDDTNQTITVKGTGNDSFFISMLIEIVFSLEDDVAHLFLTATASSDWTFPDSMPDLEVSPILTELKFSQAVLYLASYDVSPSVTTGLSFDGEVILSSALGPFGFILGENAQQALSGSITIVNGIPEMSLAFSDNETQTETTSIGFFTASKITIAIDSVSVLDPVTDVYVPQINCTFASAIPFNEVHSIPISATVTNSFDRIIFRSDLNAVLDASISELASLADGLQLDTLTSNLENFQIANILKLQDLTICVDPDSQQISYVIFGVENANSWTLVENTNQSTAITLDTVYMTFRLMAPTGSRKLSVELGGQIDVGGGKIALAGRYPDFEFSVWLVEDTSISLQDIITYFTGDANANVPDLDVVEFDTSIQPGNEYSAMVDLSGRWPINIGDLTLNIEEMIFSLDYVSGSDSSAVVGGKLEMAELDFALVATHSNDGSGWIFTGYTLSEEIIDQGDIASFFLAYFNLDTEITLPEIDLEELNLTLDTGSSSFTFELVILFPIADSELEMKITLSVTSTESGYAYTFVGILQIGTREFDLIFTEDNASDFFIAAYANENGDEIVIKDLVSPISSDVASYIPDTLKIDIKDVLLGYTKTSAADSNFLFGMDISTGIDLSNIPLVGKIFTGDKAVSVDDLELLILLKEIAKDVVAEINDLLPDSVTQLPDKDLGPGLNVSGTMQFGSDDENLGLTVADDGSSSDDTDSTSSASETSDASGTDDDSDASSSTDKTKWFTLQKSFGPITLERVGVQYSDGVLTFLLDGSLSAAGLTISLEGMSIGSPLNNFSPVFDLHGLGIQFEKSPLEIAAAFLRETITDDSGVTYDEYDGAAIITTGEFGLSAIGSYAKYNGSPSMFIYGVLDYPIGGPSFFFVTGLSAGFGYNRKLNVPQTADLLSFPLVAEAVGTIDPSNNLENELEKIHTYIPPSVGDIFFALGIKFTTFQMLDTFVLLTANFGQHFELDVLGISTMIVPTPEEGSETTPLAEIQMAIKAAFIPDEGFLGVSAQLTSNSYIISKDCHLTGGYAFYSWFLGDHAGQFVETLGGYHPDFDVPDYFPQVPRLGLNWKISDDISIKGEAYYALTSFALMAGGDLEATWKSGNLEAYFSAGADFLIAWKPYHYDASAHVEIGVKYTYHFFGTHHISAHVGADLHLWGPEFAGKAHVHLSVVSFDVTFGSSSSQQPQPIDWDTFKASFLPADDGICGITIKDGLISSPDATDASGNKIDWIINAKKLSIISNSVIPTKTVKKGGNTLTDSDIGSFKSEFGIGSMAISNSGLSTTHEISVVKINETNADDTDVSDQFALTPILKNAPAGLWGDALTPSLDDNQMIEDTLAGFEITPATDGTVGETHAIPKSNLQYETTENDDVFEWGESESFSTSSDTDSQRRTEISSTLVDNLNRDDILSALGFDTTRNVEFDTNLVDDFVLAPQVASTGSASD